MQTITTKFYGPTNSRGARVKATATNGQSITIPYDHEMGDRTHSEAATKLARKLGWNGTLIEGNNRSGNVYVLSTGEKFDI